MNKKWYAWKRRYRCLFFIEWIEMPVMPDISAHWLAGWRTRVQQLLSHDQAVGSGLLPCSPCFPRQNSNTLNTFFLELYMTLVLHACWWLLGLWSSSINIDLSKFENLIEPGHRDLNLKIHRSIKESHSALYVICVCACTQVPSVSWADTFYCTCFPFLEIIV